MTGTMLKSSHARPNNAGHRRDALWVAALLHRLSGLALAAFLPLHFLALALALNSEAALDGFLSWTAHPVVKVAEMGLIFLLTVHVLGGVRILLIENLPWFGGHRQLVAGALIAASMTALAFLLSAA
jgi:fumarate reductase subunit D